MAGFPLCRSLRQREVNQNSQIDQSQAGTDVNRRQTDQANDRTRMLSISDTNEGTRAECGSTFLLKQV